MSDVNNVDMLPNDINISFPPLCGYFGKSESEYAAALMILVCQKENKWKPVFPKDIAELMLSDKSKFHKQLFSNPFLVPDIHRLIKDGFANWVGDESNGNKRSVEFTIKGFEILKNKNKK